MAAILRPLFRLLAIHGPMQMLAATLWATWDASRQRRLRISSSGPETLTWHVAWRRPTRALLDAGLREHLGIAQPDFRRRAESTDGIDLSPPATPICTSVLLAGNLALAHPGVQAFLRRQTATGRLRIVHPGETVEPGTDSTVLLYGIAADAAGQARLLELRRRGIACDWLAAAGADTPAAEVPLREACRRQAIPAEDGNGLAYADIAVAPEPVFHRHALPAGRRPLRILTYRWHVPHQYELFKLGAEFTLVTDLGESSCRWWDLGQRPLPANARLVLWQEIEPADFDLAILHFDEHVLERKEKDTAVGSDWGSTFRFLLQHLSIPRIAVCHGTPQAADAPSGREGADANRLALVRLLADVPVVVNSHQAHSEWMFNQSQVIWQGFDPEEFSLRPHSPGHAQRLLTLPRSAFGLRPTYHGASLLEQVSGQVPARIEQLVVAEPNLLLQGNAYARAKFAHYVSALHGFDVFFNPTLHSPMPRTRGEAMLCGLATVNAASHDVDRFIRNGRNGFYADTAEELADQIRFLLANPAAAWEIGRAGRETAIASFHINRYLDDWRRLIRDQLGNAAI